MDTLKQRLSNTLDALMTLSWVESNSDITKAKKELLKAMEEADRLSAEADARVDPLLDKLAKLKHTGVVLSLVAIVLVAAGVAIGINL